MAKVDLAEWSVRANEAMDISLYTKAREAQTSVNCTHSFHPAWTYPIVGEQETIVGYKGLKIHLRFNATDMRPHFSYTTTTRIPEYLENDELEVPDLKLLFEDFLPASAFSSKMDFVNAVQNTSDDWRPPGQMIQSIPTDDGAYEVWKGNLADPLVLALVKRIQILVSLFIEGGTPIATESTEEHEADPLNRWTAYFLYHKQAHKVKSKKFTYKFTYTFTGYCTVYRFFAFRPTQSGNGEFQLPNQSLSFLDFPCRSRISQFIVLPPFQQNGNGHRLYSAIYQDLLRDTNTFEITVEDPNEAFDILRDKVDAEFLRTQPEFNNITINTNVILPTNAKDVLPNNIIDRKALRTMREKYKIAERQFSRLIEMHLMSKLPDSVRQDIKAEVEGKGKQAASKEDQFIYRLWKLVVKSRLNKQNFEQLAVLEPNERLDALQETLQAVELEYSLLLSIIEDMAKKASNNKRKLGERIGETSTSKKRKLTEEAETGGDEDDGSDEDEGMLDNGDRPLSEQDAEEPEPSEPFVEEMPDAPEIDILDDTD